MTLDRQVLESRRGRRRRRRLTWRRLAALVVLAGVFAVGIALGEALHDNPTPGGTTTTQRTLRPLPLAPVTETVTITSSGSG